MQWRLLVMATGVLFVSAGAVTAQPTDPRVDAAVAYLTTLYAFDFDALRDHLTPDAVFDDPTAEPVAGRIIRYEGRDAILEGFAASAAASRNAGFEIEQHFVTADYVVLTLTYHSELLGDAVGIPDAWVPVRISAVTILRIRDGRVAEHLDHVDYDRMLAQVEDFRNRDRPGR